MKSKNLSEKILRSVKSKGFKYIELPSVIEANHIVQRSGENFRKYLFSFNDAEGKEFTLNPDLSLSAILNYAERDIGVTGVQTCVLPISYCNNLWGE